MANETNKRLQDLSEKIKAYDGGISKWIKACGVSGACFHKYFESVATSPRKMEVYRLGLQVLKELKDAEIRELEAIESEFA